MAYNRVRQTTTTTGTGTLTLGAAAAGFRTAATAGIPTGTSVEYLIENGTSAWEVGTGVYTATGTTLTRVLESSSTGALLNLTGTSTVSITVNASSLKKLVESPTATVLGRITAGIGKIEHLTMTQLTSMLNVASGTLKGLLSNTDKKKLDNFVSPFDYGAVGDGVADDLTALQNAMNAAFAANIPFDGGDKVYAISNRLLFNTVNRPHIRSLRLKMTADALQGIYFLNCTEIIIDQLEVNRNTASVGDMNSNGGLFIDGGSRHKVRNVEVYGGGDGNGIAIWNTTYSYYSELRVRDIAYNLPAATDDVLQGIFMLGNTDCTFENFKVSNLTGNATANQGYAARFTRGISSSKNVRCHISGANVRDVDQGIDISGGDGNRQVTVSNSHCYQCTTAGIKLANSAVDCKVVSCVVDRAGQYAFGAGGPDATLTYMTQDCDFIDCTAIDTGWNNFPQAHRAFDIHYEGALTSWPRGIRIIGCRAIDRQATKTMAIGFFSNAVPPADQPNVVLDCTSRGHINVSQQGFQRPICHVKGNNNQSIPNNTWTGIGWFAEEEDTMGMHDASSNTDQINILITGWYEVDVKIIFGSQSSAGYRRVRLDNTGSTVIINSFNPTPGDNTLGFIRERLYLSAGQFLKVFVDHTAGIGVNIDLQLTPSYFRVELLREWN